MVAVNHELVIAEWRRSRLALRSASVLAEAGLAADSISRSYYAILHAAKAALWTRGISVNRHKAVGLLLNQHFIHPGAMEREWLDVFRDARTIRITADYDVRVGLTAQQAEHHRRQADAFCDRISRYLRDEGFAAAELADARP